VEISFLENEMPEFKPCIVVPFYNHHPLLKRMIQLLKPINIPCFLVNDGSCIEAEEVLQQVVQENPWITLINREKNGGKGAAVLSGFEDARIAGYTHVLQIDADCQHNTADIPKFLQIAKENPNALILGQAKYDASVPKARLYGRYITHFFVMLETLHFSKIDTLCGLRVYPLKQTIDLDKFVLGRRMDFDSEVVVKMLWRGVKHIPIPTYVTYPEDGISHFHYIKGNICISLMHTRLCLGMIIRSPILLLRKFM
jgi:glycosyltransferase involved in cell wall biosynthesis